MFRIQNGFLRKIVAVLAFSALLITGTITMPSLQVGATTEDDLRENLNYWEEQEAAANQELERLKDSIANQEAYYTQLSYKISSIENQIYTMSQRLTALNADISQKEQEIETTQKKIDENYELFKTRLRAMYMSNDATVLSVLFGSSTFSEFLSAAETTQRIAEHDDQLIKELTAQMKQIEADKAAIEESRRQIESDKAALETKQSELNATRTEAEQVLSSLKGDKETAQADYNDKVAQREAAEKELDDFLASHQSDGPVIGGGWLWPVAGHTYISDYFGDRILNGQPEFHKGIDIPCATGTPIRAAKAGTVIRANYSSSYGNIVIIDHGGGYTTVYAHNSSLKVVYDQYVDQGQTIALAGETGQAYGSHCHFEVLINGVVQNPLSSVAITG